MLRRGYIEPSQSDWAAPIVYVRKKDGSWRLCVDFRKLNQVLRPNVYPLPRIQDIFTILEGSRYFSSLDLAKGFWQIRISDASKHRTAFTTCFGLYHFKRLPMGLASAPSAFQESLASVLAGLNWVHAMVYLDDILVFSSTFAEHLQALDEVLERLTKANLRVKLRKCEFARSQLHYLGHVLNSQGIQPDPAKVQAVRAFAPPTDVKQLGTFLGKAAYYCRFIKGFSQIAAPLFRLRKKGVEFVMGEAEMDAFERIKSALCESPVLRHPDFTLPFILQTDASGFGLGAVLSQEFKDDNPGEHPVAYASRTMKDAETRYSAFEKEALAITWAIKHFEQYLLCSKFRVMTDHKPLITMMSKQHENARVQNFVLKLQHYDFTVEYREGTSNGNADTLSRYPCIPLRKQRVARVQCAIGPDSLAGYLRYCKQHQEDLHNADRHKEQSSATAALACPALLIRDGRGHNSQQPYDGIRPWPALKLPLLHSKACLLYTSDAADD